MGFVRALLCPNDLVPELGPPIRGWYSPGRTWAAMSTYTTGTRRSTVILAPDGVVVSSARSARLGMVDRVKFTAQLEPAIIWPRGGVPPLWLEMTATGRHYGNTATAAVAGAASM
jgi:hypothetical protein